MALWSARRRYRQLRRYRRIAEVFVRHGFGFLLEQLDLAHLLPLRRRVGRGAPPPPPARAARLRRVFEDLGPTFVKLGQVLSTRPDLLPADILQELEQLQDRVPAVPFEQVAAVVTGETGRPLSEVFSRFEPAPLAAASIGQVHRARLPDGQEVVVKVRRPGIEEITRTDLEILEGLAHLVEERLRPELVRPRELVAEFGRILRREMDYRIEARNIERFRATAAADPGLRVPRVFWDLTGERVLTLEYLEGVKVSDRQGLARLGAKPGQVAQTAVRSFLRQVLVDGFFHGDPHPGNLLVLPSGELAFIDFGMMGRLDPQVVAAVADLFVGLIRQDVDRVARGMTRIGALPPDADLGALKADLGDLIDRHYGQPLKEIDLGSLVQETFDVTRAHRIRVPAGFALLGKALVEMEGVGKALDPDLNVLELAAPLARELLRRRWHLLRVGKVAAREAAELAGVLQSLPRNLDRVLATAGRGHLQIRFRHEGLERLIQRLDVASNRLAAALVTAAVVVGSSFILQTGQGPLLWGYPAFGLLGFILAGVFGLWLVLSILRSGRL